MTEHAAPASDGHPMGGQQADVAAAANAVAALGVAGPGGGRFDEVDLAGLAGGVGFMVAVFEYEGYGPTMTITTRTVSMPDPFVEHGLSRAGVAYDVITTGSAAKAAKDLDAALDAGHQVLLSVETGALPYHASEGAFLGAGPRVVRVAGRTADGYLIDDRASTPHVVTPDALARARGVVKKVKHRAIVLRGPSDDHDPVAATRAALQRTVDGYDESPAKSFVNNVGTNGLRTWATRLTATNAKGWARVFAEPAHLHSGLRRVVECIDHELTSPSAGRPMFADWLERASDITGIAEVGGLADAFRTSAEHWRAIVALIRAADPALAAAADGLERTFAALDAGASVEEVAAARAVVEAAGEGHSLGGADAGELFAAMAERAMAIADVERAAVDALAGLLG